MSKGVSLSIVLIIVVAIVALVAVMFFSQLGVQPSPAPKITPPSLATQDVETVAGTAEAVAANFVDEATPDPEQVVPDLK